VFFNDWFEVWVSSGGSWVNLLGVPNNHEIYVNQFQEVEKIIICHNGLNWFKALSGCRFESLLAYFFLNRKRKYERKNVKKGGVSVELATTGGTVRLAYRCNNWKLAVIICLIWYILKTQGMPWHPWVSTKIRHCGYHQMKI